MREKCCNVCVFKKPAASLSSWTQEPYTIFPYPSRYDNGADSITLYIHPVHQSFEFPNSNFIKTLHGIHSCHTSQQVCQVTPITSGLLIERQVTGEVNGSDGLPTLFTLLHPMGDLCPVILRRPSASKFQNYLFTFFSLPYWNSPDGHIPSF